MRLEGPLVISALRRSLGELVRRHESLRTRFGMRHGEGVQIVDEAAEGFEWWVEDVSGLPEEAREQRARELEEEESSKRFDLVRGPLFRAGVIRLGAAEHVLLLTMHHIVTDGWSMGIVMRELAYCTGRSEGAGIAVGRAGVAVWGLCGMAAGVDARRGSRAGVGVLEGGAGRSGAVGVAVGPAAAGGAEFPWWGSGI